jgi:formylmethanofuran dehydrogenase subunit B
MLTMKAREHADVACTLCGCVCDDLEVSVAANRVVGVKNACRMAEPWFLRLNADSPPVARINGQPTTLDAALDRAAQILGAARAPLIYGLSRSSTPGQRAAIQLADRIGATVDTTASRCHGPSIIALQEAGESTCSLGEARHRADLVVYWGSNPVHSHPRHLERYGGWPSSGGTPHKHLAVIDVERSATAELADTFLKVAPGRDFELLAALRCLVLDIRLDRDPECGIPLETLKTFAERLRNCRCGVVFFGLGLSRGRTGHRDVESLLRLVTDLNRHTRFYARRMRVLGDVAGADSVLCWQTGYPFSVNLARGYPRYNPGEYSVNDVLRRGEVDACVLVGSESVAQLEPRAIARLRTLPVISLDYPGNDSPWPSNVAFTTAIYGVHEPGTAYRMDEVPIPLRRFLATTYPSDHAVLNAIESRLSPAVP